MPKDVIAFHMNKLRIAVFSSPEACYEDDQDKKEPWVTSCKSYSLLTISFRKILYGGYYS